ncbi:MAG TPA: glycosyltransferase family A protein [Solirubrobacterales bacterium]
MPAPSSGAHQPRASTTTIGVVVPATDRPPTLHRCLAALDSGSRRPDQVVVQEDPPGSGPAAARNLGVAACEADLLIFVDADVEVHSEALALLEQRFAADPDLVALFGAYDEDPADSGLTSRYRNLLHHQVHAESAGAAETFWAGLGAVRRREFELVGGFDADRYPEPSIEDIELGMRLRRRGAKIVLDPGIRGRHLKRWTPRSMVSTDFRRRGVPWARLLLREGSGSTALNLGWRHRLAAAASLLLLGSLLARRKRLALAALAATLVLDRDLYALLARRGGAPLLVAGVGLHQLHRLTAVASIPAALILESTEGAGS